LAEQLLGLVPPAGFPALTPVTLPALMADPLAAVAGYWQQLAATPVAMAEALHQGIAGSTLTVFKGARHITPVERPDDIAAKLSGLLGV
jgi:3-oxoadipate enol-lactonase